jgi:hypothetical protein
MKISTTTALTGLIGLILSLMLVLSAHATPISIIDDFEDGDASDWGYFGGNAAGGGGGVANDRPKEGSFYLSTGWGGQGTNSGFYGGAFKNFANDQQVVTLSDTWFNVWVLNQSNTTVDQYSLEITIREDLNGDGWTDGLEDSFGLNIDFDAASFDDEWTLFSAPLTSFFNRFTGGDGTFNGSLDEIVFVIAGVVGADGSIVEVDFDLFAFSSGGPIGQSNPDTTIPEPSILALFGLGLAGLVFTRRQKVKQV